MAKLICHRPCECIENNRPLSWVIILFLRDRGLCQWLTDHEVTGVKQTGGLEMFFVLKWKILGLVEKPDASAVENLRQTHLLIIFQHLAI